MSKTRAQLVSRALQKIRVVGAGQTASSEDSQLVDDIIEPMMKDLSTRGIYSWGDDNEYEDDAFEHLADLLGNASAPDFGKAGSEETRKMAEGRLRLLDPVSLSHQPLRTEYF